MTTWLAWQVWEREKKLLQQHALPGIGHFVQLGVSHGMDESLPASKSVTVSTQYCLLSMDLACSCNQGLPYCRLQEHAIVANESCFGHIGVIWQCIQRSPSIQQLTDANSNVKAVQKDFHVVPPERAVLTHKVILRVVYHQHKTYHCKWYDFRWGKQVN